MYKIFKLCFRIRIERLVGRDEMVCEVWKGKSKKLVNCLSIIIGSGYSTCRIPKWSFNNVHAKAKGY